VPESAEPTQSPSVRTPAAMAPHVPAREAALRPQGSTVPAGSRIVDLITGTAKVGIGAATLVAGEITSRSVSVARIVLPASIAEGPLDTVERHLGRRQEEARKSDTENRESVAEVAESVLNRVVVGVVDMLDMEQLIDHVPINKVVARVDLPGVIDEIDLAGVIRESTTGLGTETLDASRAGLMAVDLWSARLVDRILRRKEPRDLTVPSNGFARPEGTKPEVIS
jgi:ribosomal protein L22